MAEHENIDENIIRSRLADYDLNYQFEYIDKKSKAIVMKKREVSCSVILDSFRYSVYKVNVFKNFDLLLFTVHLPSMLHKTELELGMLSTRIKSEIENIEKERKIQNSIVVGDFNMNPFSPGMTDVYGFNSIMCKRTAMKENRTMDNQKMYYFYNPMWHLMGNRDNDALGTYFYHNRATSYIWNTFDQVILRPTLINLFEEEGLQIITQFAGHKLLDINGKPNAKRYSDHLPLQFEIREECENG